jgi:type VI secretion system protein ImpL
MNFIQGLLGGGQMSLMGLIVFVLVTYFSGTYVPFMYKWRAPIIIAGAVLFFIVLIIQKMMAKKSAAAIEDRLQAQAQEQMDTARPDRKPQVQALQKQLSEAIASLKTSKMGAGALYSLPWYIIIGPPGSGKSTALQESGLNFPYMSQGRKGIRGVGGTRNCDWWFTDQGILLDTAGRYTTELEDRDEWLSFLDMLKKCRKRKPINGAIVCVSVADLVQCNDEEREAHVKNIRDRIDELTKRLEQIFPVYLVFTKCDLLNGFTDFFEDFGKTERSQVWGFTLPYSGKVESYQAVFDEEVKKLYGQLSAQRVASLAAERPMDKKRRIFGFPLQFAMAHRKLADFVGELFRPNPFQESSILRGIYFTSGTQEGTPIDQLVAAMGGAFGLQEDAAGLLSQAVDRKSYFINALFSKVIFGDQNLARSATRVARRRRFLRASAALGSVAALIVLCVSMAISTFGNWRLVHTVGATAGKVKEARTTKDQDLGGYLKSLGDLREHIDMLYRYNTVEGRPFWLGWGLYRGQHLYLGPDGKSGICKVYVDSISSLFVKPVSENLLAEMKVKAEKRGMSRKEFDKLYDLVMVYKMLVKREPPNKDLMKQVLVEDDRWVLALGAQAGKLSPESRTIAGQQLDFYINQAAALGSPEEKERYKDIPLSGADYDGMGMNAVIESLANGPWVTESLSDMLKLANERYEKVSHESLIKARGRELFTCPPEKFVPGCFTQRAYNLYLRSAFQESSEVLAKKLAKLERQKTAEEVRQQFRASYRTEYVGAWQAFLEGVELKPFENLRDATTKLKILTASESAFRDLFKGIWEGRRLDMEGEVTGEVKDERKWLDEALKALDELQQSLAKILDTTEAGKRFISAPEGSLKDLSYLFVKAKRDIENAVKAIPDLALQPSAVRVLARALQSTLEACLIESQAEAETLWKTTVVENYKKNLAGKYPLVPTAAEEIPMRSFSEVFNPKSGSFWNTVKLLQRLKDGFKFEEHVLVRLSPEYDDCVKSAEVIRNNLYPKDSELLELTLPAVLGLRGGVTEVFFHTNKVKSFSSMTEPDRSGTIIWNEAACRGTKIGIRHDEDQLTFHTRFDEMDWGLLRLFSDAKMTIKSEKLYEFTWELSVIVSGNQTTRKADCTIEVKDKVNPFVPGFFTRFKCPEKLAP